MTRVYLRVMVEGDIIAYLIHHVGADGWTSLSELLHILVAGSCSDETTSRLKALHFNLFSTITAIAKIDIYASLHTRMTTITFELHPVSIAIQAFPRHCRR